MSKIPNAIGPYSVYRKSKEILITSGQLPLDPETNKICSDDISLQVIQCLNNIETILQQENLTFDNVLKLTMYMTDLSNFESANKAFEEKLGAPYPARTAIEISKLPMDALVEIEAIVSI